jgi:hypothetical protein
MPMKPSKLDQTLNKLPNKSGVTRRELEFLQFLCFRAYIELALSVLANLLIGNADTKMQVLVSHIPEHLPACLLLSYLSLS